MKLAQNTNDQLMATAAHRYCLGRRTYIVGSCTEWIRATWEQFTVNTRRVMVRDTIGALMDERAGDVMDAAEWMGLSVWMYERLPAECKAWVCDALAYKNKGWPLKGVAK